MPRVKEFFSSFLPRKGQIASIKTVVRKGVIGIGFLGMSYCLSSLRKMFGATEESYEVSFFTEMGKAILIDCVFEAGTTTLSFVTQKNKVDPKAKMQNKQKLYKTIYLLKTSVDIGTTLYVLINIFDPLRQLLQSMYYSEFQNFIFRDLEQAAYERDAMGEYAVFQTLLNNNLALIVGSVSFLIYNKDIFHALKENKLYKNDAPIFGLITSTFYILNAYYITQKNSKFYINASRFYLDLAIKLSLAEKELSSESFLYQTTQISAHDLLEYSHNKKHLEAEFLVISDILNTHEYLAYRLSGHIESYGKYKLYNSTMQFIVNIFESSGLWDLKHEAATSSIVFERDASLPRPTSSTRRIRLLKPQRRIYEADPIQDLRKRLQHVEHHFIQPLLNSEDHNLNHDASLQFDHSDSSATNAIVSNDKNSSQIQIAEQDAQKEKIIKRKNKTITTNTAKTAERHNPADAKTKSEAEIRLARKTEILALYPALHKDYKALLRTLLTCTGKEVRGTISVENILTLLDHLKLVHRPIGGGKVGYGRLIHVSKQNSVTLHYSHGKDRNGVDPGFISDFSQALGNIDITIDDLNDLDEIIDSSNAICCQGDLLRMIAHALTERTEVGTSAQAKPKSS